MIAWSQNNVNQDCKTKSTITTTVAGNIQCNQHRLIATYSTLWTWETMLTKTEREKLKVIISLTTCVIQWNKNSKWVIQTTQGAVQITQGVVQTKLKNSKDWTTSWTWLHVYVDQESCRTTHLSSSPIKGNLFFYYFTWENAEQNSSFDCTWQAREMAIHSTTL